MPISSFAQTGISPCNKEPANVEHIFKKEGWTVPGLQGSREASLRTVDKSTKTTNIFRTELVPANGEFLAELPYYILKCDQLEIKQRPLAIRNISRADVGGKVFAYLVEGVYISSIRPPVIYMGAVSYFLFVDTTGSGVFDLYETDVYPLNSEVPSWVQKLATGNTKMPKTR